MGQRVKPAELREMLKVARKLRDSAYATDDADYTALFVRAADALEDRAAELAFYPTEHLLDDDYDAQLYKPVDFRC